MATCAQWSDRWQTGQNGNCTVGQYPFSLWHRRAWHVLAREGGLRLQPIDVSPRLSFSLSLHRAKAVQAVKAILHFATLHDALIPNPKVYRDELTSCLGLIGSAIQGQGEGEVTGIPIPMSVSLSNLLAANTRWSWFKTWVRIPQAAIKGNVGRISGRGDHCRLRTC